MHLKSYSCISIIFIIRGHTTTVGISKQGDWLLLPRSTSILLKLLVWLFIKSRSFQVYIPPFTNGAVNAEQRQPKERNMFVSECREKYSSLVMKELFLSISTGLSTYMCWRQVNLSQFYCRETIKRMKGPSRWYDKGCCSLFNGYASNRGEDLFYLRS